MMKRLLRFPVHFDLRLATNFHFWRSARPTAVVVSIAVFSAYPFASRGFFFGLLAVQLALLTWGFLRNDWNTARLAALFSLIGLFYLIPLARGWPSALSSLMAVLLYCALLKGVRKFRPVSKWLCAGRPTMVSWIASAIIAGVSAVALVIWFIVARPEVGEIIMALITRSSPAKLLLLGFSFAVLNAGVEEIIWRGAIFDAGERTGLPIAVVVGLQAASFGIAHLHGFPGGAAGILLSSVYGVILGIFRAQTQGILVPFVTHAVTDFSIFGIVVYLAHD